MSDHKPCPFCGSTNLLDGSWYIDDEEVDAVECARCAAGAPASVWNRRAATEAQRNALLETCKKAAAACRQIGHDKRFTTHSVALGLEDAIAKVRGGGG